MAPDNDTPQPKITRGYAVGRHSVELPGGRMVAPGEPVDFDLHDVYVKRLVEKGTLVVDENAGVDPDVDDDATPDPDPEPTPDPKPAAKKKAAAKPAPEGESTDGKVGDVSGTSNESEAKS